MIGRIDRRLVGAKIHASVSKLAMVRSHSHPVVFQPQCWPRKPAFMTVCFKFGQHFWLWMRDIAEVPIELSSVSLGKGPHVHEP